MTPSEDDTENEDADLKQIVRNVSSVKTLGKTGNFSIYVQVATLRHSAGQFPNGYFCDL
jgi:hypothetical protein